MKTVSVLKNLFALLTMGLLLTSCFESDAENAVEDMGEEIERSAEKASGQPYIG